MKIAQTKPLALLLLLLLSLGLYLAAGAQEPPPSEQRQGPIRPKQQQQAEEPYALRVDVPLVNVDVTVVDRKGNIIPGLRREHFRVYLDGEEQEVVAFAPSEASLTTVLLVEANPGLGRFLYDNLDAAYLFLNQMRKDDWVALVSYDMKSRIVTDFTHDRRDVIQGLRSLQYGGGFREANMYDALADTLDRIKDVEGKKSIVLIGTGLDTFSKLTWSKIRKITREHRTTVYGIGMTWLIQLYYDRLEAYGYRTSIARMDLNVAQAQMRDLAEQTGGRAYFPRFQAELPGVYQTIGAMLRNQYTLAFRPRNFKPDGKYHKIEIKLVGPDGKALAVVNEKGKKVKYKVHARRGYYAPAA